VPALAWAGLAVTTLVAAILQAASGFGFAVLAAPLFLLFVAPAEAIQLIIIIATALSLAVLPGMARAIARPLLLRLALGGLAGLPLGLVAFEHADPTEVRIVVGATILGLAGLLAMLRWRGAPSALAMRPSRDLAAGAVSGVMTSLLGMAGPPIVAYLLLAGVPPQTARATLLSFFALTYAVTLLTHIVGIGIPGATWVAAGVLLPVALLGGVAGRRLGDRLGATTFAWLALGILVAAGGYTLATALRQALVG